jgi:hypothetical protein
MKLRAALRKKHRLKNGYRHGILNNTEKTILLVPFEAAHCKLSSNFAQPSNDIFFI